MSFAMTYGGATKAYRHCHMLIALPHGYPPLSTRVLPHGTNYPCSGGWHTHTHTHPRGSSYCIATALQTTHNTHHIHPLFTPSFAPRLPEPPSLEVLSRGTHWRYSLEVLLVADGLKPRGLAQHLVLHV